MLSTLAATFLCAILIPGQPGSIQTDIVDPYVEVRTTAGGGAGTVIKVGDEILVLTAAHVVAESAKAMEPKTPEEAKRTLPEKNKPVFLCIETEHRRTVIQADIVGYSTTEDKGGTDLALVKPRDPAGLTPAIFCDQAKIEPGQECWYIGTPMGVHRMLEKTIVNRPLLEKNDHPYIVVNGQGTYGNSGGGLFVKSGDKYVLVGVVTRRLWTSDDRNPLCAQTQKSIKLFIDKHVEAKNKKPESAPEPKKETP